MQTNKDMQAWALIRVSLLLGADKNGCWESKTFIVVLTIKSKHREESTITRQKLLQETTSSTNCILVALQLKIHIVQSVMFNKLNLMYI
jgi:hypothetical protein